MSTYRDDRDERIERLQAENAALRGARFTALDWIALIVAAIGALVLCGCAFVSSAFGGMYRDFGGALPLATRIAVKPWSGPLAALPPLALLVGTMLATTRLAARRRAIIVAFAIELITIGAYAYALYAPLFLVASRVHE